MGQGDAAASVGSGSIRTTESHCPLAHHLVQPHAQTELKHRYWWNNLSVRYGAWTLVLVLHPQEPDKQAELTHREHPEAPRRSRETSATV